MNHEKTPQAVPESFHQTTLDTLEIISTLDTAQYPTAHKPYLRPVIAIAASLVLVTALCLATPLGTTVAAAVQSLFRNILQNQEDSSYISSDLAKVDDYSTLADIAIPIQSSTGETNMVHIVQSYYDGIQLYLGYTFDRQWKPSNFTFKPTPDDKMEIITSQDAKYYLDADYDAFMAQLQADGHAGMIQYSFGIGDGCTLADGTYLNPYETGDVAENGLTLYYTRYETPLPPQAQNQDELQVQLTCYFSTSMIYAETQQNGEILWYHAYGKGIRSKTPCIPIKRSTVSENSTYSAKASLASCKVQVEMIGTATSTTFTFTVTQFPSSWADYYNSMMDKPAPDDFIDTFEGYIDGELFFDGWSYMGLAEDGAAITYGYDLHALPEGAKELVISPKYRSPDLTREKIVFDLTTPT